MAVSSQDSGRVNQKRRTRKAIIEAARELAREGKPATVAAAAAAALVSRATAYRYFPTQHSLLIEVAASSPDLSVDAMLAGTAPQDLEGRLEAVVRGFAEAMLADEASFRALSKAALDRWFEQLSVDESERLPVREGRRLWYLETALAPLRERLEPKAYERLLHALSLTIGVEAVATVRDICRLDARQTEDLLAWTASVILRSALDESKPITERHGRGS